MTRRHRKPRAPLTTAAQFFAVLRRMPEGCWEWPYAVNSSGYGELRWHGKVVLAHRLACFLAHGPAPVGAFACHTRDCSSRRCCAPAHLYWGTMSDNNRDVAHKRRWQNGAPPTADFEEEG